MGSQKRREVRYDGDGTATAAGGVVIHSRRRFAQISRASVLPEVDPDAGGGRFRSLDREPLSAVLPAGRKTRPAEYSAGRLLPHAAGGLFRGNRQPAGNCLAM